MIGWLQGRIGEPWREGNRCGVLLLCQGVGYEVQLNPRLWHRLPPQGGELTLHVHQSVRDDGWTLYGFDGRQERDLFRELVSVSGVGPQMALALLGTMESDELVRAIVQTDLRRLSQAPGVGKRTAERLSVELRLRLQARYADLVALALADPGEEVTSAGPIPEGDSREEICATLEALGYGTLEIHRALRAAAGEVGADASPEEWIRACLLWLSRSAA
jgi:Holliday junction DNA helicase RuvA